MDINIYLFMADQGLWHSVSIFFGCILLWQSDTPFDSGGLTLDFWSFGTLVYHEVIVVVSLKVCDQIMSVIL